MFVDQSILNKRVVAYWGPMPGQFGRRATGRIVAYSDRPTLVIEEEDGSHSHWAADLCELDAVQEPLEPLVIMAEGL